MDKNKFLELVKMVQPSNHRNSMGCSENWYNFFYAMKETFSIDELEKMTQHEIDLLDRLHEKVSEGLY